MEIILPSQLKSLLSIWCVPCQIMLQRCVSVIMYKLTLFSATCFFTDSPGCFHQRKSDQNHQVSLHCTKPGMFQLFSRFKRGDFWRRLPHPPVGRAPSSLQRWNIRSAWMQISLDYKNHACCVSAAVWEPVPKKKKETPLRKRNEKEEFVLTDLKGCHSK